MKTLKVTLVIVTFDRLVELSKLLCDLKEQTLKEFEVILVSDGCNSSFKDAISLYKNYFPIISLDTGMKKNYGLANARNIGISAANSTYCILLDDDCRVNQEFLEQHYLSAEKNTIVGGKRFSNGDQSEKLKFKMNELEKLPKEKSLPINIIRSKFKNVSLIENNISFYKEDIQKIGFFFELIRLYGLIGQEFFYRAELNNLKFKYNKAAKINHLSNAKEVKTNKKNRKKITAIFSNIIILPLLKNRGFSFLQKNIFSKSNPKFISYYRHIFWIIIILFSPLFITLRLLKIIRRKFIS